MTLERKLERVNKWRWKDAPSGYQTNEEDEWNGVFIVPLEGEMWRIISSDGEGWKHVSISNFQKRRELPDWQVMCRVKALFFDDEAWVVQYHPPTSEYINDHPGTLHLWQPLEENLPTPHFSMV